MSELKEKIREILAYIGANEGEGLSEIMPVIEEHIREGTEKAAIERAECYCFSCCFKEKNCLLDYKKEAQTTSKIAYTSVKINCCAHAKDAYDYATKNILKSMGLNPPHDVSKEGERG